MNRKGYRHALPGNVWHVRHRPNYHNLWRTMNVISRWNIWRKCWNVQMIWAFCVLTTIGIGQGNRLWSYSWRLWTNYNVFTALETEHIRWAYLTSINIFNVKYTLWNAIKYKCTLSQLYFNFHWHGFSLFQNRRFVWTKMKTYPRGTSNQTYTCVESWLQWSRLVPHSIDVIDKCSIKLQLWKYLFWLKFCL